MKDFARNNCAIEKDIQNPKTHIKSHIPHPPILEWLEPKNRLR
jgi:hypothetical protein